MKFILHATIITIINLNLLIVGGYAKVKKIIVEKPVVKPVYGKYSKLLQN